MERTQVVVVGGGPTGLMLACELRLAGVEVVVLDRAAGRSGESRAGGLHARTLEILDQRGIVDRFLSAGRRVRAAHFSGLWLDLTQLDTRYPYVLGLIQARIEALLEERAAELGARVRWSAGVTGLAQTGGGAGGGVGDRVGDGVTVEVEGGAPIEAGYLVGCDGGHSTVRRLAGIGFSGTAATVSSMLADVELDSPPDGPIFQERRPAGDFSVIQLEPGWHRLMTNEYDHAVDRDAPVDFAAFRDTFRRISGVDYGMRDPRWVSRYNDAARLADRYRAGRVFLAGDAAHVHWPAGGQGLNTGVQDAVNLGWKLAMVLGGHAGDALLDTYEAERRPVAQRVLHNTRAQAALARPGAHTDALRETMAALIALPDANRHLAGMITALDLGHRAPDVPLPDARPVLLGDAAVHAAAAGWADRIDRRPGDTAMLVRPDGYVAWAGGPDRDAAGSAEAGLHEAGLHEALRTWCGRPGLTVH